MTQQVVMTQPTIGSNVRILGSRDFFHCQQSHVSWFQVSGGRGETWEYYLPSLGPGRSGKTLHLVFFGGKTSEAWKICRRICVPIGLPTSRTPFPCSLFQCSVSSHYYAWCVRWFSRIPMRLSSWLTVMTRSGHRSVKSISWLWLWNGRLEMRILRIKQQVGWLVLSG